jgi:hypothetical protein
MTQHNLGDRLIARELSREFRLPVDPYLTRPICSATIPNVRYSHSTASPPASPEIASPKIAIRLRADRLSLATIGQQEPLNSKRLSMSGSAKLILFLVIN